MIALSIVVPIYNEEDNIELLYQRLISVIEKIGESYELIFVNDGSKDKSIDKLKIKAQENPFVKYIDFSRNFGHQIAVTAGLELSKGESIVIIDGDLQDPPELIEDLYQKKKEGFEVVYARRKKRKGESWLKKFTARVFYRILKNITSIDIPVDTGDFRIIDRKIVEVLREMPEYHRYIRGQISWIGYNQTYVEYERDERNSGVTGYSYSKMFKFALDGITSFSDFPLKLATFLGFIVSIVAFVTLLFALYARYFTSNYEPGWTSIIISILFLGGIQLVSIGIIGEYISRINTQVKRRPLYIVKDTNIEK